MGKGSRRERHEEKEVPSEEVLECKILIPIKRDSDRKLHGTLAWREFVDELRSFLRERAFSGPKRTVYVRDVRTSKGEWKGVKDESRTNYLDVPRSRIDDFRRLVQRQCDRFDQKVIRMTVTGPVDYIKRPDGEVDATKDNIVRTTIPRSPMRSKKN